MKSNISTKAILIAVLGLFLYLLKGGYKKNKSIADRHTDEDFTNT